jgi:hypothetical protein
VNTVTSIKANQVSVLVAGLMAAALWMHAAPDASAAGTVGWALQGTTTPTRFAPADELLCETESLKCDAYQFLASNVGDQASSGVITLTDILPPGVTTRETPESGMDPEGVEWSCTEGAGGASNTIVTCTFADLVKAGGFTPRLTIRVHSPTPTMHGTLENEASVSGGGAAVEATASQDTAISTQAPPFEVSRFDMTASAVGGAPALGAGAHPWSITTKLEIPLRLSSAGTTAGGALLEPAENVKSIAVELPVGLVGNPQTTAHCTETQLRALDCPPASRVGTFVIGGGAFPTGELQYSDSPTDAGRCCSAIYNMAPEHGYPAQFGFAFIQQTILLYASVVRGHGGDRLRVLVPGVPSLLNTSYTAITFFGDPGRLNGGSTTEPAFLTNPSDCASGPLTSRVEMESWSDPGHPAVRETPVYPALSSCGALSFDPGVALAPSSSVDEGSSQADAPSAYSVDLTVPQTEGFNELATPPLKDATVTLPAGVSVNPGAAQGLIGCAATGPEGINVGSDELGAAGQDLGDPEATELGAGYAGGDGSPYDDGVYHTAKGHCPPASTLGTAEVFTPLLPTRCGGEGQTACKEGESPAPLQGRIFLGQPACGGAGQPGCTEASATNGELFHGYIEVEGDGVIVKLPGKFAANPQSGQLTGSFKENPQFPFSDFKLHFHGGPRAPLANPQSCGSFATSSLLSSWGGQEASGLAPAFNIDWDGQGGACPASLLFAPTLSAGTTQPTAGAFSPFVLTFSRQDREQDLSGLSVTLPPGLLGKIAGVSQCGEAQANAGTCAAASQIGTASVTAGPGSNPLSVTGGRVYLTTGYKGAPFGLSVVVPAVAGPFNLGDVVVRAAIHIDPATAQVSVVSDPLPQARDGVPFRLRAVNVAIDRTGFTLNPTNCAQQQITGTIAGAQGASAGVASPFAVAGCASLPFKPTLSASTQARTSKANGASLVVRVAQKAGEANIHKVALTLPRILPARLTTLQKACTEGQFAANPANCPAASAIGTATAVTPILDAPLTGPAYLVSHGGAAFPDVEFVLQGQGVTIVLDGKTDIKKGVTYSRFETVPDAPISSFATSLPEGPHSVLAANGNLCAVTKTVSVRKRVTVRAHGRTRRVTKTVKQQVAQPLTMPTTITAQNGAQVTQNTKLSVSGCPKFKPAKQRARPKGKGRGKGKGKKTK